MMRFGVLMGLWALAACGSDSPCGVAWDGDQPALGTMVLSDGTVLRDGTWADTRLNAGTFTIDVRAMGDEPTLGDALSGDLPVCRTLDDQNDAVIYQDGGPWITDASHSGNLAVTEVSDGAIKGRFEATLRSTSGASRTLSGAFFLPSR